MGGSPCVRFEKCREENNYLTTNKMASNKELGEQWGIHPRDIEKIKFAFEVYDFKEKGKKTVVLEDMYPLFKKAKDSKATGGIHDFVEILKLYDKISDKPMLSKDLFRLLTNLGEKLTKEEAKGLMNELCDPEDAEGFTPFMPFLERMCKNDVA